MKSLETQLHEKQQEIDELRRTPGKKTDSTTRLIKELSESGLPAAAQHRLRKRFETSGKIESLREAIREERDYVNKVHASANGNNQDEKQHLAESYRALGLSEKESAIAAGLEVTVKDVTEAHRRLANAAKLLGMSDAEAAVFSRI